MLITSNSNFFDSITLIRLITERKKTLFEGMLLCPKKENCFFSFLLFVTSERLR